MPKRKCTNCNHYEICEDRGLCSGNTIACDKFYQDKSIIIELPCKLGDTLYTNIAMQGWYMRRKDRPYPAKVVFIGLNSSEDMGYGYINVDYGNGHMWQFNFSDIGKTVFLTRGEAEMVLDLDEG